MVRTHVRYGSNRQNIGDLWLPDGSSRTRPVVVLVHGGFWRAPYTKALMNGLAGSIVEQGWAAWNIEYRRVGIFGGRGGWPTTFDDVAAAVDHLDHVDGVDLDRVVGVGHSAGGQLAFWVAARRQSPEGASRWPAKVPIRSVVSLAGLVDLEVADRLGLGNDATSKFLGGHHAARVDRYNSVSPGALLPLHIPQVLVHGLSDRVVPPSMSQDYRQAAVSCGDAVEYVPLDGVGHRELIDPRGKGWLATLCHLEELLA
jgi:acetyl esterase/lipase